VNSTFSFLSSDILSYHGVEGAEDRLDNVDPEDSGGGDISWSSIRGSQFLINLTTYYRREADDIVTRYLDEDEALVEFIC